MHDKTEYINSYKAAVATNAKLIIASGCLQQDALTAFAKDNETKRFISCDFALGTNDIVWSNNGHDKCAQLTYKAEQSGFLAGIAAAVYLNLHQDLYMKDKKLNIGSFGGANITGVTNFMAGLKASTVWWNDKVDKGETIELKEMIKNLSGISDDENIPKIINQVNDVTPPNPASVTTSFEAGTENTKTVILNLLNKKVDVIMPVAGPQTGDCIKYPRKR